MPRTLRFSTHRDQLEQAEETLWALGAHAVTLCDPGGQPLLEPGPGETPLWEQARVEALLPDELDSEPVLRALAENGIAASPGEAELSDVPDRDWERAWMDRFEPMRFGESIWICPWHVEPDATWPVVVRLDPGLAFGTGTHATTALCLEWLDANDLTGLRVIDFGCGSGVLAIAAALKGAAHVLAVDHDPQALDATRDNAQRNGVSGRIETVLPENGTEQAADLVLANILAGPLIEMAETIAMRVAPGGSLVLSGILEDQADDVERAYEPLAGYARRTSRDGWVRLDFGK